MSVQALPRSRWRWLRTSVRGLILLVMVIAAGLGWIVRSARIQREAVVAINGVRGGVAYDWEMSKGRYNPAAKPWAPRRLVELIGIDYFFHVTQVRLSSSSSPVDATMAHVGRLSRLQRLYVSYQSLTDSGLGNLAGLTELSRLDLCNTHIGDAGLAHLSGLIELSVLDLGGTRLTDAGIAHLKGLTKLSVLDLRFTQVTDAGLAHLNGLHNLSVLYLSSTRVTDHGLAHLKGLSRLSYLVLRNNAQITDAGLVHLEGLTKLTELNVDGTQVTKNGMRSLQRALPGLKIYHPRAAQASSDELVDQGEDAVQCRVVENTDAL
jgi:internalin A